MRVGARVLALWCLLMPAAVFATEQSPHELYDAINGLTVDPSQVYRLVPEKRIELRRGDAVIALEEGTFAFFSPLHGRITGAVFSGRGHVLAAPRDPVEKQQMGRFLGSPVLDEAFGSAYLRFTDGPADELLLEFRKRSLAPQTDTTFLSQWSLRSPASMRTTLFVFSSTSCRLIRGRPSSPGWTAYPPALSTSSWTDAAMSNFSSDKRSRTLPERFMTLGCPTGSRIPRLVRLLSAPCIMHSSPRFFPTTLSMRLQSSRFVRKPVRRAFWHLSFRAPSPLTA